MSRFGFKARLALLGTAAILPASAMAGTAPVAAPLPVAIPIPIAPVPVVIAATIPVVSPPAVVATPAAPVLVPIVSPRPILPEWGNISPFSGNISPFSGNISPFSGNISPFSGNISPFNGNISPFNGNISPFSGNISPFSGNISPFWGNISPFWGNISPFSGDATSQAAFWGSSSQFLAGKTSSALTVPDWQQIAPFWTDAGNHWTDISKQWSALNPTTSQAKDYADVAHKLSDLSSKAQNFWGSAIQSQTGQSFAAAFANPLLAKYGIDLNNPQSLAALSPAGQQQFFLEWYDGLMNFSGRPHVDHWMQEINWSPSLTITQGLGKRSIVGLLDFTIGHDADVLHNVIASGGISTFTAGHGAAVASLIVGGSGSAGVFGIAPMASIAAYNPFDSTGTAGFPDVTNGLVYLTNNHASIVNASLGVPGWTLNPSWNDVFSDRRLAAALKSTVFVLAAGNEGIAQPKDIAWNYAANPALIVVGSVDPTGHISSFSNTPGTACLTDGGVCKAGNQLMNRFIVAPGEQILVSDDNGGVRRASGTSFAAPLVSGAIALLDNRWPWLSNHPVETVNIILGSAKHLGDPGVNSTYGVGELDVTASQSPLSFNNLSWYVAGTNGNTQSVSAATVTQHDQLSKWQANNQFLYAFENIGATFRDFAIPLSSKLVGLTTASADGSQQMFQSYLTSRLTNWINTTPAPAGNSGPAPGGDGSGSGDGGGDFAGTAVGFNSFATTSVPTRLDGYHVTMSLAPRTPTPGFRQSSDLPYQTALALAGPGNRVTARVGFGDGAVALGGQPGLSLISDYNGDFGGANPLLGMASGGGYANADVEVLPGLRFAVGATERRLIRDLTVAAPVDRAALARTVGYHAGAQNVSASYRLNDAVSLRASYTRLHESNALLGTQSLDPTDFAGGTTTQGVSIGTDIAPGSGIVVSGTATIGRTNTASGANFQSQGVISTAFEGVLSKNHVFDATDRARLSFSQPLYLERGSIGYTGVEVIDRQTGALGQVTHSFDITQTRRRYVGEMLYAHPLFNGTGEADLFGRVTFNGDETATQVPNVLAGARVRLGF